MKPRQEYKDERSLKLFDLYMQAKDSRAIKNQSEFCEFVGIGRTTFHRLLNEAPEDITDDILNKAASIPKRTLNVPQETFIVKEPEAEYIGRQIGTFKTKSREFIELSDGHYIMHVPLVNQKAYAGYLTGWGDSDFVEELPRHPILVDKPHKGEYISFEVKGDSMDDGTDKAIQDGDIITGRKIERSLWKSKLHLKKYSEFVIVTIKKGIIVKHIIEHDTSVNEITCRSYNTDKKQYPDFNVNLDTVMQLFNVIQVTKKRRV